MSKRVLGLMFICISLLSQAQQMVVDNAPQMADVFREEGKIYVVIAVIALIFLSLLVFLLYIERKLKKIEKQINKS